MSTAVLSIGANLGDRLGHLQTAVDIFRPWLRGVSPVYETAPWGPIEQDDYLNAVLLVADARATPADWLARAHAAERAAGRTRDVRWGPRTLDVDVIVVDDTMSDDPALTLPHPRAAERAFVLVPWLAIDPDARLGGREVRAILDGVEAGSVHARPDLVVA
jgi:2-amino-4-hydroxy-6-hydroxymethyldihydropteridine diphosphokinase